MNIKPHLLLVDDDRILSPLLEEYLQSKGFRTTLCFNAMDGLEKFKSSDIDLCVLDVKMPMKDGFTLAQEILELSDNIPFLFLTSEAEKEKKIKGLKLGADDYILKPFSMEELYLRIQLILRRFEGRKEIDKQKNHHFNIGKFNFKPNIRELSSEEKTINLSTTETQLLQMFCESKDRFVDRDIALKRIWKDEYMAKSRSLNVYVSKLRKYFKADSSIVFLNVHGQGYQMIIKN